jgi:hypothetical protein
MTISPPLKDIFLVHLWPFLWKVRSIRDNRKKMTHKFLLAELSEDRPWCDHTPEVKHHIRRLELLFDIRNPEEAKKRSQVILTPTAEVALILNGYVHVMPISD